MTNDERKKKDLILTKRKTNRTVCNIWEKRMHKCKKKSVNVLSDTEQRYFFKICKELHWE
jgi:hypothetical protein